MKDSYAKYYDLIFRHKDYERECFILRKYLSGKTILDVGCGTGIHGKILQRSGFEVYGVEPNRKAAEIAKDKGFKKVWISKAELMDLGGKKFDNVLMLFQVFNYLDSPNEALRSVCKVLKTGGKCFIDILNFDAKLKKFATHFKWPILRLLKTERVDNVLFVHHFLPLQLVYEKWVHYLYTKYEMINMLNANGFFVENYLEDPFGSLIICRKQ